jgi:hypothetical protein
MVLHNVPLYLPTGSPPSNDDQRTPPNIEWFNWGQRFQSFEGIAAYDLRGSLALALAGYLVTTQTWRKGAHL